MKRRQFLQFTGSTLTTLGLSQTHFLHQADRYDRALAASPKAQKLALLIGINQYPAAITSLQGCLTDIAMQHELLVHRYGFKSQDIRIIADRRPITSEQEKDILPTRQNIIAAFQKHLIAQAEPGDIVVIHFSGHGAQLKPHPTRDQNNPITTLVPNDRTTTDGIVPDISEETLFYLKEQINTENITLILDSCYSGGALRGNAVKVRFLNDRPNLKGSASLSPEELDLQKELKAKLQQSRSTDLSLLRQNSKGIMIGAVQSNQLALDAIYGEGSNQFHAGAFTYLLTQYLWQTSGNQAASRFMQELSQNSLQLGNTNPALAGDALDRPLYFQSPPMPWADAVVQGISDNQITYWLGGQSDFQLSTSRPNSIWSIIDSQGQEIGQIKQTSRQGLTATGTLHNAPKQPIQPGTLLRKRISLIPSNFKLKIALYPPNTLPNNLDLKQIWETIQQKESFIQVVPHTQADCLLGQITAEQYMQQPNNLSEPIVKDSIGLFTPTHRPLWYTFLPQSKAKLSLGDIIAAITQGLKNLVAIKYLKQLANAPSLWEAIAPTDEKSAPFNGELKTAVVPYKSDQTWQTPSNFQLSKTPNVQINIQNKTPNDLIYPLVISVSSENQLVILYPYDFSAAEIPLKGDPSEPLYITLTDKSGYPLQGSGRSEILIIADNQPMTKFFTSLKEIEIRSRSESGTNSKINLNNGRAIDFMKDFLGSIDRNTRSSNNLPSGDYAIDHQATMRIISHQINIVP